jgi:hypothetical protein
MYMNAVGPPVGPPGAAAEERRRRLNFWVNVGCAAFLVIVPLAVVLLLLYSASNTYAGGDGSSHCLVSGYPTNVDSCSGQR